MDSLLNPVTSWGTFADLEFSLKSPSDIMHQIKARQTYGEGEPNSSRFAAADAGCTRKRLSHTWACKPSAHLRK